MPPSSAPRSVDRRHLRVDVVCPFPVIRRGIVALLDARPDLRVRSATDQPGRPGLPDVVVQVHVGAVGKGQVDHGADVISVAPGWGCPARVTLPLAATGDELLAAVEQVATGVSPHHVANSAGLSDRQYQTVGLVARGHSNTEIAEMLFVSVNTVKTTLRVCYQRLGVHSRAQATLWFVQEQERMGERMDTAPVRSVPTPP